MSEKVIRVEGLGKQYFIGERSPYGLLSESIGNFFSMPFRGTTENGANRNAGHEEKWIWALKDVSFEVEAGEVFGVVGRNGAGKSTLLKILSRVTVPTEGRVELHGSVAALLEVGTGFHPELTGRENVFLYAAILGISRRRVTDLFERIVEYAEMKKFMDTPLKFYSSGMRVRLGFSTALHVETDILILDEVLAVGDEAFREKCYDSIFKLRDAGRTILVVTHNLNTLKRLASRCLLLDHGRNWQVGTTDEIVDVYKSKVLSLQRDV